MNVLFDDFIRVWHIHVVRINDQARANNGYYQSTTHRYVINKGAYDKAEKKKKKKTVEFYLTSIKKRKIGLHQSVQP